MQEIKVSNGKLQLTDDGLSRFMELASSGKLWDVFSNYLNNENNTLDNNLEVKINKELEEKINTILNKMDSLEIKQTISTPSQTISHVESSVNQSSKEEKGSGDTAIKVKQSSVKSTGKSKGLRGLRDRAKKMKELSGGDD